MKKRILIVLLLIICISLLLGFVASADGISAQNCAIVGEWLSEPFEDGTHIYWRFNADGRFEMSYMHHNSQFVGTVDNWGDDCWSAEDTLLGSYAYENGALSLWADDGKDMSSFRVTAFVTQMSVSDEYGDYPVFHRIGESYPGNVDELQGTQVIEQFVPCSISGVLQFMVSDAYVYDDDLFLNTAATGRRWLGVSLNIYNDSQNTFDRFTDCVSDVVLMLEDGDAFAAGYSEANPMGDEYTDVLSPILPGISMEAFFRFNVPAETKSGDTATVQFTIDGTVYTCPVQIGE